MSYWSFAHHFIINKLTNFNHSLISSIQDERMHLNSIKSSFNFFELLIPAGFLFQVMFVLVCVCNYFCFGLRLQLVFFLRLQLLLFAFAFAINFVLLCVCSDFYFAFAITFVLFWVCNCFLGGCARNNFCFGLHLQLLLFWFAFAMTQANFLTFDPPRATQRLYFADWHSQIFSMRSTAWIDITFTIISKMNSTRLLLLQLWP